MEKYTRFSNIGFEDFRNMAEDSELSDYEKIGFPDKYRKGSEDLIFHDILKKLSRMNLSNSVVLDIGCGCSELPRFIINNSLKKNQELYLVDSEEMLNLLPDVSGNVKKIAGYYPNCDELLNELHQKVDAIICYSVFQYVFTESNVWSFLDRSLDLLAPGGEMLIGDIPNISMRKRFFKSEAGKKFHKEFIGTEDDPDVEFNCLEENSIDDSVVLSILMRARSAGFNAYLIPQTSSLPMANRREDILITRP